MAHCQSPAQACGWCRMRCRGTSAGVMILIIALSQDFLDVRKYYPFYVRARCPMHAAPEKAAYHSAESSSAAEGLKNKAMSVAALEVISVLTWRSACECQSGAAHGEWGMAHAQGYISVPIVMGEKVEMTVSKGVLRIGGTIVGGTLGFLVMLRGDVASDPYLTMFFVVLFSFVFGLAGRTQYLLRLHPPNPAAAWPSPIRP